MMGRKFETHQGDGQESTSGQGGMLPTFDRRSRVESGSSVAAARRLVGPSPDLPGVVSEGSGKDLDASVDGSPMPPHLIMTEAMVA